MRPNSPQLRIIRCPKRHLDIDLTAQKKDHLAQLLRCLHSAPAKSSCTINLTTLVKTKTLNYKTRAVAWAIMKQATAKFCDRGQSKWKWIILWSHSVTTHSSCAKAVLIVSLQEELPRHMSRLAGPEPSWLPTVWDRSVVTQTDSRGAQLEYLQMTIIKIMGHHRQESNDWPDDLKLMLVLLTLNHKKARLHLRHQFKTKIEFKVSSLSKEI